MANGEEHQDENHGDERQPDQVFGALEDPLHAAGKGASAQPFRAIENSWIQRSCTLCVRGTARIMAEGLR
jgi:hypothetical protein